ncbi:hypothetical protein NUW54_g7660 [Trametes sanguinea]|uniref:Uncharacterized protein n=1 Tax=Trametes sanguinea TaxID=158606 RepID=A0ACC1PKX9_9APHY|nr:hypothetical protein NUW54_g7660 [Trametes sanguinea]
MPGSPSPPASPHVVHAELAVGLYETEPNQYGVFHRYRDIPQRQPAPPSREIIFKGPKPEGTDFDPLKHCNIRWLNRPASDASAHVPYGPFENKSIYLICEWFYNSATTKSLLDLDTLVKTLHTEGFQLSDLANFSAHREMQRLDDYVSPVGVFSQEDGWHEGSLELALHKAGVQYDSEDKAPTFTVDGLHFRKILEVIQVVALALDYHVEDWVALFREAGMDLDCASALRDIVFEDVPDDMRELMSVVRPFGIAGEDEQDSSLAENQLIAEATGVICGWMMEGKASRGRGEIQTLTGPSAATFSSKSYSPPSRHTAMRVLTEILPVHSVSRRLGSYQNVGTSLCTMARTQQRPRLTLQQRALVCMRTDLMWKAIQQQREFYNDSILQIAADHSRSEQWVATQLFRVGREVAQQRKKSLYNAIVHNLAKNHKEADDNLTFHIPGRPSNGRGTLKDLARKASMIDTDSLSDAEKERLLAQLEEDSRQHAPVRKVPKKDAGIEIEGTLRHIEPEIDGVSQCTGAQYMFLITRGDVTDNFALRTTSTPRVVEACMHLFKCTPEEMAAKIEAYVTAGLSGKQSIPVVQV